MGALSEPLLPPGLVYRNGDGIGKVEATAVGAHGQAQSVFAGKAVQYILGQAAAFRAEQKGVSRLEAYAVERLRAFGGEGEHPRLAEAGQAAGKVRMAL